MSFRELKVELGESSYPIFIGSGLLSKKHFLSKQLGEHSQLLVISNETIAPLYLKPLTQELQDSFPKAIILTHTLPDGESFKTLEQCEKVLTHLLESRFHRNSAILALGGGVIGDLAGFSAAVYQRGIDFYQLPTTLLAQVDSSVGGKTAVNHSLGKNMIGAFHQPRGVFIDTDTLKTLPDREFAAGLAEVIKYGLIQDAEFFEWIEDNLSGILDKNQSLLAKMIEVACRNKAKVVAEDEKETGLRAILNFGHTFGHAFEQQLGYGTWLHGEAVACGMLIATRLSEKLGKVPPEIGDRLENMLSATGLPKAFPSHLQCEDVLATMRLDKKNHSDKLRLIMLNDLGQAIITEEVEDKLILEELREHQA